MAPSWLQDIVTVRCIYAEGGLTAPAAAQPQSQRAQRFDLERHDNAEPQPDGRLERVRGRDALARAHFAALG